ncbi:hypothetical protein [Pseudomonas viridiflava]|uniref:hypothetical protein n=1 Tax=Pseudomonas viridiflava TaxID=33069 RepID=UPI000F0304C7|nr:hypothetical protein [Pseudomonas viridiflava]
MRKQHGPALKVEQLGLSRCLVCNGRAVVKGVFHELACVRCNASGWVLAASGQPLPLEVLVTQLSIRLQAAELLIAQLERPVRGAQQQYEQNNRRGAGGSNYTGD